MLQVITLKVTPAELELIDWLVDRLELKSRSDAIRSALIVAANRAAVPNHLIAEVQCQRYDHQPIRSPRVRVIQDNVLLDCEEAG